MASTPETHDASTSTPDAPASRIPAPETPHETAIELSHVTKEYHLYKNNRARLAGLLGANIDHEVLLATDDVSFSIKRGETVAFLGRNGAGKSTLLKLITGVVYPTSGTIDVNGRVSAMLELSAGFDKALTGRENIHMRAQIWGLDREEAAELEPKVLKFANLGTYIDQPVRTYSSGMRSRLGFAFAASIEPDILIVDETLAVGDRKFKRKCKRCMRRLMRKDGVTVLLVTHSLGAARKLCKRGIVMDKGKLVFDGPIEEAAEYYKSKTRRKKNSSTRRRKKRKMLREQGASAVAKDTEDANAASCTDNADGEGKTSAADAASSEAPVADMSATGSTSPVADMSAGEVVR